jgi:anti-sigma-K factor RskA
MDVHDLTAAYALDALAPDEAEEYEAHLGQCEECRTQLAELNESSTALAFGTVAPAPPAHLRESILSAAAAERSNVVPIVRRRYATRVLAVAAAAAACLAVGFTVSALQSSGTHVVTVAVVLAADHTATLQVDGLAHAPQGKTYEAWIIPAGRAARPAGLFAGGEATSSMKLRGNLPAHAVVAVTLEPAGGDSAPTTAPLVEART